MYIFGLFDSIYGRGLGHLDTFFLSDPRRVRGLRPKRENCRFISRGAKRNEMRLPLVGLKEATYGDILLSRDS